MNNIRYLILTILLCTITIMHCMEESKSPVQSSSESSSSSSSSPKKSILKKGEKEKNTKKKAAFTPETVEYTRQPLKIAEDAKRQEYQQEQRAIELEQISSKMQIAEDDEKNILENLISFTENTIPEVEHIIDTCANDIVEIWNFFDVIPASAEIAKENFAKLRLAIRDYERNIASTTHRSTGRESAPLIIEYGKMLDDLKLKADYELYSNPFVEKLDELISDYMAHIIEKASKRYTQAKQSTLNDLFSKIRPDLTPQQQYANAVHFGQIFLDDAMRTENEVDSRMKQYQIKGYSKTDYSSHLYAKAKLEKNMVIERVLPYVEKIGNTKNSLMYVF